MKVMSFHLMPYADLDLSVKEKYRTVWIVLPNSYYDPKKGHALYNRYLDELELCAELGFDGVCVNEHHQNAYGLMPSPVVMDSARRRLGLFFLWHHPGPFARPPPGSARPRGASMDRARSVRIRRQALSFRIRESVAPAVPAAASADLVSIDGKRRDAGMGRAP